MLKSPPNVYFARKTFKCKCVHFNSFWGSSNVYVKRECHKVLVCIRADFHCKNVLFAICQNKTFCIVNEFKRNSFVKLKQRYPKTNLRAAGLGCRGVARLFCRRVSARTLSATLGARPSSSASSSLWRRWGGGGGRNSMLPRGVVLLLPGSVSCSASCERAEEARRMGGGGFSEAWDMLRLKIVPLLATPG